MTGKEAVEAAEAEVLSSLEDSKRFAQSFPFKLLAMNPSFATRSRQEELLKIFASVLKRDLSKALWEPKSVTLSFAYLKGTCHYL